jgi:O-antigen ligase
MEIAKRLNLNSIFILLFLILFPFGQIIRIGIIQPIDIVVGLAAIYSIIKKMEAPEVFKYLRKFFIFASASWIFSLFIFQQIDVAYGLLYLFRLGAYIYFGIYVSNFIKLQKENAKLLINSLLSLSIISSLFGWIQYISFPDIKPFTVWGWDMHLFRLVGTFLDPTFLSLIIVFGLVISINRLITTKKRIYIASTIFLLATLAFTYSRAGYLAFIAAVLATVYLKKRFKKLLFLVIGLVIVAFLLPTAKNHSIELFRSFSAVARLENYQTTLKIFSKSPVFGVGYNNMCIAYQKYIGVQDFSSHACSGSDSSILFILATTGILGLTILVYALKRIASILPHNPYRPVIVSSFVALLVHSLFANSMFYSWIIGWMMILLAEAGADSKSLLRKV